MSMPPAIANTFLFEMMKSKSKDVTLAAIYALGKAGVRRRTLLVNYID